jgi:hypothetical protein
MAELTVLESKLGEVAGLSMAARARRVGGLAAARMANSHRNGAEGIGTAP